MKHELSPLPFSPGSLAPTMSAETIEFHYGKHHKAYVDKLNQLIVGTPFENASLEEIIKKAEGPIFNNAAQIWNHSFFWECLTPNKPELKGELKAAIEKQFGSQEAFQKQFADACIGRFGSGWAWLVKKDDGTLAIESTSNADTPVKAGKKPLMTFDVWEHAYYIDYRNDRAKFVQSIWNIVNWDFVAKNFKA